jgi:hypothetical protein
MPMLSRIALFVARTAITAWIGAAVLFVMVGVREVTSPQFSLEVKDQLAVLRFPLFYLTGWTLVMVAHSSSLFIRPSVGKRRWTYEVASGLLGVVFCSMLFDYFWIYVPLVKVVTPPGQPRTAEFEVLHTWSSRINILNLGLCLIAACLLNWPRSSPAIPLDQRDA